MSQNISSNNIYQTQIPALTDAADIQNAFKLYHFGSTTEPASASVSAGVVKHLYDLETSKASLASSPTFTGTLTAPTINASTALQIGGVAITSSAAELNLIDNSVAGTIVNSKALIYGAAGQVNATTFQISGTSVLASGTPLPGTYGGTGVNNGTKTITIGGNIAFSGAYTQTFTATGNTSVTLPTSGILTTTTGTAGSLSAASTTGTTGTEVTVIGGATTNTAGSGGTVRITGGAATSGTSIIPGGSVYITGGASNTTNGIGGSVEINAGAGNNTIDYLGSVVIGNSSYTGYIGIGNNNTYVYLSGNGMTSGTFVKRSPIDNQLTTASIAYYDLPTNVGVIARKVTQVGAGTGTTINLTHGLGTNLVTAQVYNTSTSTATLVTTNVTITVTSTVATATFGTSQTLSNYTLVVVG